jgi:two-component system C4-dicarboxylate transport sensor histidine kinase DctB
MSLVIRNMGHFPLLPADEKDPEQLCFALIHNAIQAAGGQTPHRMVLSVTIAAEQLCLRFGDDCGGIAHEHADKIFEPFFTTELPSEGTGSGLCIVERIVNRAAGQDPRRE